LLALQLKFLRWHRLHISQNFWWTVWPGLSNRWTIRWPDWARDKY